MSINDDLVGVTHGSIHVIARVPGGYTRVCTRCGVVRDTTNDVLRNMLRRKPQEYCSLCRPAVSYMRKRSPIRSALHNRVITHEFIRSCSRNHLLGIVPAEGLTLLEMLRREDIPASERIWLATRAGFTPNTILQQWVLMIARRALASSRSPDHRSVAAIDTAEEYLHRRETINSLAGARATLVARATLASIATIDDSCSEPLAERAVSAAEAATLAAIATLEDVHASTLAARAGAVAVAVAVAVWSSVSSLDEREQQVHDMIQLLSGRAWGVER